MAIDRAFTRRRARHGRHRHGRLGGGRGRRRAGMAPRGPRRPGPGRSSGTTGRSSGSAGARGRRSTSSGVHHAEVRRGQELAAPGYLADPRVALGRGPRLAPRPRGRSATAADTGSTSAPPRSPATLALLDGERARPRRDGFGQLFLAEPVVAVYGQPFVLREESPRRDPRRRPGPPAGRPAGPPPRRGRRSSRLGRLALDRPRRARSRPRLAVPGSDR